ncbi:hypothetical protein NDU88_009087 [Pleurodeles waltl]|uniref:Uncharacterized protein n=1 Tax=Pleurodeles waltl TaxID=8319 RepID=A0AAV7QUR4_PLEWA|nr:hypothetical protein NDU88_009087 [Pleurodeles waltl]
MERPGPWRARVSSAVVREGPIRGPGRPRPAASGSRLPRAERREAPQAQSAAAAPSQHNSWGGPGLGPKDGCSALVGALLYLGAHGPAPSSRARVKLAAVSEGTRLRGPGLSARDREGPIHLGVMAGEGPVPDRRRPNPATHRSRLPRRAQGGPTGPITGRRDSPGSGKLRPVQAVHEPLRSPEHPRHHWGSPWVTGAVEKCRREHDICRIWWAACGASESGIRSGRHLGHTPRARHKSDGG